MRQGKIFEKWALGNPDITIFPPYFKGHWPRNDDRQIHCAKMIIKSRNNAICVQKKQLTAATTWQNKISNALKQRLKFVNLDNHFQIFSSLNTPLDFNGIDGFVILQPPEPEADIKIATFDLTLEHKPYYKADILIRWEAPWGTQPNWDNHQKTKHCLRKYAEEIADCLMSGNCKILR